MKSDFDAARASRAEIVELGCITYSTFASGKYYVEIMEGTSYSCACPDFEMRQKGLKPCKHILALRDQVGVRMVRWPDVVKKMEGE